MAQTEKLLKDSGVPRQEFYDKIVNRLKKVPNARGEERERGVEERQEKNERALYIVRQTIRYTEFSKSKVYPVSQVF